jgi:hypothetical protein
MIVMRGISFVKAPPSASMRGHRQIAAMASALEVRTVEFKYVLDNSSG